MTAWARSWPKKTIKLMIGAGQSIKGARVGILGLTFKENCPDLRNSKVVDIVAELASFGVTALVHDPLADPVEARSHYGLELAPLDAMQDLGAVIIAVAHGVYRTMRSRDFEAMLDETEAKAAGLRVWRL
jgi:UDP-N-acetyl-D-galactosamine dehydrogenase